MKRWKSFFLACFFRENEAEQRLRTMEIQHQHVLANLRELYQTAWRQETRIELLENSVNELQAKQTIRTTIGCIGERN